MRHHNLGDSHVMTAQRGKRGVSYPASTRFHVGLDLAWADKLRGKTNESGIVMLDPAGRVAAAGWTVGVDDTVAWLDNDAPVDTVLFVDAPLVVNNETGQRCCEKQVGRCYGGWRVFANSTNRRSPRLAGVELLSRLEARGWIYQGGLGGPPTGPGRFVSECYPYTTIVGACELGYAKERPRYKRKPPSMSTADFRPLRNAECDELIRRVDRLKDADPPMDLSTHCETHRLVAERSPDKRKDYKHREDLLDAALCAWTAALWSRWGETRCQVLGLDEMPSNRRRATIVAPVRPKQRRDSSECA